MLKVILLLWLGAVLYWSIGIGVSLLDRTVRDRLAAIPNWDLKIPANISPERVVQGWILYLPMVVVLGTLWGFTNGARIVHKMLYNRMRKH